MFPRYLHLFGLLSFCLLGKPSISPVLLASPIQVGTAKQVFIDGRFLGSKQGVELVVNRPRATGEMLLVPENPWESGWIGDYLSVIQEGGRVHMWYDSSDRVAIKDPKQGMTGVAMDFVLYPGKLTLAVGEDFSAHVRHLIIRSPELPDSSLLEKLWSTFNAEHEMFKALLS